jgi:hypothetical protein
VHRDVTVADADVHRDRTHVLLARCPGKASPLINGRLRWTRDDGEGHGVVRVLVDDLQVVDVFRINEGLPGGHAVDDGRVVDVDDGDIDAYDGPVLSVGRTHLDLVVLHPFGVQGHKGGPLHPHSGRDGPDPQVPHRVVAVDQVLPQVEGGLHPLGHLPGRYVLEQGRKVDGIDGHLVRLVGVPGDIHRPEDEGRGTLDVPRDRDGPRVDVLAGG